MSWLNNTMLLFKSNLKKDERRLLERAIKIYNEGNGYKISSYSECKRLVTIGYKLGDRMDYLFKKGKLTSDEYESTKYKNQCINVMIKEYSMNT